MTNSVKPAAKKATLSHSFDQKLDPLDRFVWGASSIAAIINRSPRQTYYLAERGLIDVDRIGNRWRSTPRRLLRPQRAEASRGIDAAE